MASEAVTQGSGHADWVSFTCQGGDFPIPPADPSCGTPAPTAVPAPATPTPTAVPTPTPTASLVLPTPPPTALPTPGPTPKPTVPTPAPTVTPLPTPAPTPEPTWPADATEMEICHGARTELQKKFTETWLELSQLLGHGEALADKELQACQLRAELAHEEKMDEFENVVGEATQNIAAASATLKELQSLLDSARTEAKMLQDYISALKKDCKIKDDVSVHIKGILEMIHTLSDCPGRNDFRLSIPESTTPEPV